MKGIYACITGLLILLYLCPEGKAHRVNVFAYIDGDLIRVECGFSKSQRVNSGKITVLNAATGERILEGRTNAVGEFSFRPPEAVLKAENDLLIIIDAGQGHRNDWIVSAGELKALDHASGASPSGVATPNILPVSVPPKGASGAANSGAVNEQQLEALIGRILDAKLAPVHAALARLQEHGPGLKDIIGGIGWILGLMGVAAYMKYRTKP